MRPREADEAGASIAWIEPALRARTTIVGSPAISSGPARSRARRVRASRARRTSNALRPAAAAMAATATGRSRWTNRSRKKRKRNMSAAIRNAGRRDAEVRDGVLLDSRQQRERERERPDQHRKQDVQHAVPVPEPHVAGREGVRRHLDDEDADGDDEAGQRRGRPDDRPTAASSPSTPSTPVPPGS